MPIFALGILPLREEFDRAGYGRRLTTIADLLKPVFAAIHEGMAEGPFKEDVVREANRMSCAGMLQDAVCHKLIDLRHGRRKAANSTRAC